MALPLKALRAGAGMKLSCAVQHADTEAALSDALPLALFSPKHGPVNSWELMTAKARRTPRGRSHVPRLRPWAAVASIGFHVSIGFFLGLTGFALTMVACDLIFLSRPLGEGVAFATPRHGPDRAVPA
ncbi:hypothetical protein [Streptomyces sp. 061-3]|uniref:hypothetical protein n=1 Tax=Streptomyces sp. 061-3 TaxID=2789268 RepID=UPI00397F892E